MDLKNKMKTGFNNIFSFSIINILIIIILIIILVLTYLQNNKLELLTLQSVIDEKTQLNNQKKEFINQLATQAQIIQNLYNQYSSLV